MSYSNKRSSVCVVLETEKGWFPEAVFERIDGKRGERAFIIIDDYYSVVGEKGWEANSRMGARICRDRYFEFFCLGSGDCGGGGGGGGQQRFFFSVCCSLAGCARRSGRRVSSRHDAPRLVCSRLTSRVALGKVKLGSFIHHRFARLLRISWWWILRWMYRLRVDERGQFEVQFREVVALCYRWRRNSVGRSALFTYPFANETTSLSCLHRSVSKHEVFLLQRLCYKKYIYI